MTSFECLKTMELRCLLRILFRLISTKISKLITDPLCGNISTLLALCAGGNRLATSGFPSQRASNVETFPCLDIYHHGFVNNPSQFPWQISARFCLQIHQQVAAKEYTKVPYWAPWLCCSHFTWPVILHYYLTNHMGEVTELRLSCYLVLLSIDSKTR